VVGAYASVVGCRTLSQKVLRATEYTDVTMNANGVVAVSFNKFFCG
jgi:hypothetical protein